MFQLPDDPAEVQFIISGGKLNYYDGENWIEVEECSRKSKIEIENKPRENGRRKGLRDGNANES